MYPSFGIFVFEGAIQLSLHLVKVVNQGADVPKDHPESLLHLWPPAIGVVEGSPGFSGSRFGFGFHPPVGQLSPAGGAVVVGLVLVGKPVQTHWNKVYEIDFMNPPMFLD